MFQIVKNLFFKKSNLSWRYQIEFGSYLRKNPVKESDDFYKYISRKAKKYVTLETVGLDVGCGLGRFAMDVANSGADRVYGIDVNSALINEAKEIYEGNRTDTITYRCKGSCLFLRESALDVPFDNNFFSFVSCVNLIDRVKDPQKVINECIRVLKPGGILFFSDPYDWNGNLVQKQKQVENIKDLLKMRNWNVKEENNIPYVLFINKRRSTHYCNHLLILQKK